MAVELVGVRSKVRKGMFVTMIALAAIGFVSYLLPAHGMHGSWHSNFADGGGWSLLVLGVFGALALVLRKRGLGAGMLTGVLSAAAAVGAVAPVILTHLFSHFENGPGEYGFGFAITGLFFCGPVLVVAEPILYWTQRSATERAGRPRLPTARVYA